jgi:hypothetical protein
MSVLDEAVVDAIGVETSSNKVVLTVSDHLDWTDEKGDLLALEKKLNAYLAFVESGELNKAYPHSIGRQPVIDIVGKFPISKAGRNFLKRLRPIAAAAGIEVRNQFLEEQSQSAE